MEAHSAKPGNVRTFHVVKKTTQPRALRNASFVLIVLVAATIVALSPATSANPLPSAPPTYGHLGDAELQTLERTWYAGDGSWHLCANDPACAQSRADVDWGADSLTYSLWLRWITTRDRGVTSIMAALLEHAMRYSSNSAFWSDVPMWDAIADAREYEVTGNQQALVNAENAFAYVDQDVADNAFQAGFCPGIHYQLPHGGGVGLKTLETDSNYIKAALLLYEDTGNRRYLSKAEATYANVRTWFLEPGTSLYTVYLWDDGSSCVRVRRQFFSSVNGNMIWNGHELGKLTAKAAYTKDAKAAEQYLIAHLSDAAGVFESLQQENDTSEELVEAMWALARDGDASAKTWILTNMSAAASGETANGIFGRFFGGMPPNGVKTSAWAGAGGISLAFAAAALDPSGTPAPAAYWAAKRYVADNLSVTSTPGAFTFVGRAVSLVGTLAPQPGHIAVFLDGTQTGNELGIDQGYPTAGTIPHTVLFAWRWPTAGKHTIAFRPPAGNQQNVKQGAAWFSMQGYYYVP
jgi:hypothetical protein